MRLAVLLDSTVKLGLVFEKNWLCSEPPRNPAPTVLMYFTARLGQLDLLNWFR